MNFIQLPSLRPHLSQCWQYCLTLTLNTVSYPRTILSSYSFRSQLSRHPLSWNWLQVLQPPLLFSASLDACEWWSWNVTNLQTIALLPPKVAEENCSISFYGDSKVTVPWSYAFYPLLLVLVGPIQGIEAAGNAEYLWDCNNWAQVDWVYFYFLYLGCTWRRTWDQIVLTLLYLQPPSQVTEYLVVSGKIVFFVFVTDWGKALIQCDWERVVFVCKNWMLFLRLF